MSKTVSKAPKAKPTARNAAQRTEKKKPRYQEPFPACQKMAWLNEERVPVVYHEVADSGEGVREFKGWESLLEKKHLHVFSAPQLKINRARILDWLLDVCRAFELRWESYWCAVELLDFLIFVVGCVQVNTIHITAVTALFMASKIHESEPPALARLLGKAVYGAFSQGEVVKREAEIVLECTSSPIKPRYMFTIYNVLHEVCPELQLQQRTEIMRRLVMIWMDPVSALQVRKRRKYEDVAMGNVYVCYHELARTVVRGLLEQVDDNFEELQDYYQLNYQCENTRPGWEGLHLIRP